MTSDQIKRKYGVTAANATVADILFIAANEELHLTGLDYVYTDKERYSCCAVELVIKNVYGINWFDLHSHPVYKRIMQGLRNMGVRTGSTTQYDSFQRKHGNYLTQQARYTWLMFAYEMALEQGV